MTRCRNGPARIHTSGQPRRREMPTVDGGVCYLFAELGRKVPRAVAHLAGCLISVTSSAAAGASSSVGNCNSLRSTSSTGRSCSAGARRAALIFSFRLSAEGRCEGHARLIFRNKKRDYERRASCMTNDRFLCVALRNGAFG
jgi:hypothetical protein